MIRWGVLVASATVVAGAAFVTGASAPVGPRNPIKVPDAAEKAAERVEPGKTIVISQKTGYFNMAKVMREFKKAKSRVERLNREKDRMSKDLIAMRAKYVEMKATIEKTTDKDEKEGLAKQILSITRKIEDADRDINKALNDKATVIIAELYDEIHAAVKALARENGLVAVLAYPDAVTPEETNSPYIKELKLKPPAAQPFYLDPSVEYSDAIIRRLNEKADDE